MIVALEWLITIHSFSVTFINGGSSVAVSLEAADVPAVCTNTLRQRLFPADSQAKNSTLDEATDIAALEHSDSLEVLPPPLHRCRTTPCPTQKLGQRYVLSPPSHLERG